MIDYVKREWADLCAAASNIIFTVALWPSVVEHNPPAASTCALTVFALVMLSAGMLHKRLFLGVFFQCFCIALWCVLWVQAS